MSFIYLLWLLDFTKCYATTIGLSGMLDGPISHDKITRLLNTGSCISKDLWLYVKPTTEKNKTI